MAKKQEAAAEEQKEAQEGVEEQAPKKSRKGLFLGGGMLALVATAYTLSVMAVPAKEKSPPFQGPFIIDLFPPTEKLQVNLSGDGGKRYLVVTMKAEFMAYKESYAATRVTDPLSVAMRKDALIKVARKKTKGDLDDPVGEEIFRREVRDAIEPILFPVHVGSPGGPNDPHEESNLKAGPSNMQATLRSGFHTKTIRVDGPAKMLQLGEGPTVPFTGSEMDLMLSDENGKHVFVDVTALDPSFVGEVNVGVFGSVRNIYFDQFLVQ